MLHWSTSKSINSMYTKIDKRARNQKSVAPLVKPHKTVEQLGLCSLGLKSLGSWGYKMVDDTA
jgi:hypothetical protein